MKHEIHKDLLEAYKLAHPCHCEYAEESCDKQCFLYASCHPAAMCSMPCTHCLAWSGYGDQETIDAILERANK